MERLVLVHGSVSNGPATWREQEPLAGRYDLVVVNRPGFPPGPPADRVDFDEHADWLVERLEPGDHLCGHSYGGVVSLLAADRFRALRSLTVIEPPATSVARGNPAADAFAAGGAELWRSGPRDPEAFLRVFLKAVGSTWEPSSPLSPELEAAARTLRRERGPWEAEIPLASLRATSFPKLVVSGAHQPAFDAICDALENDLGAERAVCPGAGHAAQAAPCFNAILVDFLERASAK